MQWPGKVQLTATEYIRVQNVLIQYKLGVGVPEVPTLLLFPIMVFIAYRNHTGFVPGLLAGMLFLTLFVVWMMFIELINRSVSQWSTRQQRLPFGQLSLLHFQLTLNSSAMSHTIASGTAFRTEYRAIGAGVAWLAISLLLTDSVFVTHKQQPHPNDLAVRQVITTYVEATDDQQLSRLDSVYTCLVSLIQDVAGGGE